MIYYIIFLFPMLPGGIRRRRFDSAFVTFPQGSTEDWSIAEKINACMFCIIPLNPGRWMWKVTIVYCIILSTPAIVKDEGLSNGIIM